METAKVKSTNEEEEKQREHFRVEPTHELTEYLLSTESNVNCCSDHNNNTSKLDKTNIDRYRPVTPHLNYLLEPNRELHPQWPLPHSIVLPHSPSLLPLLPSATSSINPLTQKVSDDSVNNITQTKAGPLIVSNVLERAVVPFTGPSSALITKNSNNNKNIMNNSGGNTNNNLSGTNKGALSLIRRPICPTCLRPFPISEDYMSSDNSNMSSSSEYLSDDAESASEHRPHLLELEQKYKPNNHRIRSNRKVNDVYDDEHNMLQYKTGRDLTPLPLSQNERRRGWRRRREHSLPVIMSSSQEYFHDKSEEEEEEELEYLLSSYHHQNARKRRYHRRLPHSEYAKQYNRRLENNNENNETQYGEVQPYSGSSTDLVPRPFSPQYFRALAHFIPLAITDKAMPISVDEREKDYHGYHRHHHRHNRKNNSSESLEEEEEEEQHVVPRKQHTEPIYNYVSPLSLITQHGGSSDGNVNYNEEELEEEEEDEDWTKERNEMLHDKSHHKPRPLPANSTFPQSPIRKSVNYGEDVGIEWNDSNSNVTSMESEEEEEKQETEVVRRQKEKLHELQLEKDQMHKEVELPNVRQTMPFVEEKESHDNDDNKLYSSEPSPEMDSAEKTIHDEEHNNNQAFMAPTPPIAGPPFSSAPRGYYAHYFVEVQKLGSGTYGGVFLCQHVVEGIPLGLFAVKKIPVGDNSAYLQNVLREVRILEEVKRHPNVIEYNHSWVEEAQLADFGPPVRCLFILMEYATEGSLDVYLERHGTSLSNAAVWYFFLSAVAGTAHLHGKQILHRDLKPQNLLLTGPRGKPPRVLVSDFGTAALLNDFSYERTGGTGTLEYMAPELLETWEYASPLASAEVSASFTSSHGTLKTLKNDNSNSNHKNNMNVKMESRNSNLSENNDNIKNVKRQYKECYLHHHEKASDVWSLGMILYYLMCDATLPTQLPGGNVVLSDVNSSSPFQRPAEMIELMKAMLHKDPKRRPSCDDILRSPMAQQIIRSLNAATSSSTSSSTAAFTGRHNKTHNMSNFHHPHSTLPARQLLPHVHERHSEISKSYSQSSTSSSDSDNDSDNSSEEDNQNRRDTDESNHKNTQKTLEKEFVNRTNHSEWSNANDAHKIKSKRKIAKMRRGKDALQNSRVELLGTVTGSSETEIKKKLQLQESEEKPEDKNIQIKLKANQPLLLQYTTSTAPQPTQATSQDNTNHNVNHIKLINSNYQQESITTSSPSSLPSPMSIETMSPLLHHDLNDLSVSQSQDEANSEIRTQRQGKRHRVYTSHPQMGSAGNSRNFLFAEGTNVTVAQLNQSHHRQYTEGGVQTDEGNMR